MSVANVFGNEHVEEQGEAEAEDGEDGSTEGATSGVSATRPRVITHASAPDLASSAATAQRTQQAQRAAGTGAVRRARIVSGLTHVAEGGRSAAPGLGMGRPQGAVRPTAAAAAAGAGVAGRVVSSSAAIGVGARSGAAPVKPPRMVGPGPEQKTVGPRATDDSRKVDDEAQVEGKQKPVHGDAAASRTGGVKVITTRPGGTTKTRQFFRPTSSSSASSSAATTLNASTLSNTSRPTAEPRRVVGRTVVAGAQRSGGLSAPTASSAAKIHRVPGDALAPQTTTTTTTTTGSSSGARPTQQAQAKPIVSPRRPRPKLKPPIPVFMPTSKGRAPNAAPMGTRPRVKTSAAVVEPASVPLPESPAPRRVRNPKVGEGEEDDPFAAAIEVGAGSSVPENSHESATAAVVAEVVDDAIQREAKHDEIDDANEERDIKDDAIEGVTISSDSGAAAADDCALDQKETEAEPTTCQLAAEENSTGNEGETPPESLPFEETDTSNPQMTESQASNPPTVESVHPAAALEVNLIDLDGPELSVTEPVHAAPSPAKRTPLGPAASPNQMTVPRKMATPKTKSPKVQQLSEFFENKAFSPSPSPERAVQLAMSGRRSSTTPLSTPPRPRVLS